MALPTNPCCALWKEKLSKLQQKLSKSDNSRAALRKGLAIYEEQIAKIETEKANLTKAYEEARMQADNEREEKVKESAMQVSLESKISALKSKIYALNQKASSGPEDVGEEVLLLQTRVSEGEKEINLLKEHLEKAKEARKTVEAEKARAEKLQEDNERVMKMTESALRESLENEISDLKSRITSLQEPSFSGTRDVDKEVSLLQARVSEGETQIKRLLEDLQKEKRRADSEKKKAEEERNKADAENSRARKDQADKEKEEKVKERDKQVSLENEISVLKSQMLLSQLQAGSGGQDVDKEVIFLKARVSERETEINRLNELLHKEKERADPEKKKADAEKSRAQKVQENNEREDKAKDQAMRVAMENELSDLKSEILLLQQRAGSIAQNAKKEVTLVQAHFSEREAEINRLKKLLEKEKIRGDFEKKRADDEQKKFLEISCIMEAEKRRAEKVLEGNEKEKKAKEMLEKEISDMKSQILLLQQGIGDRDKEASLFQTRLSEKQAEMNRLKGLFEVEKKKAEVEKKKVNEARKITEAEKGRTDEERRLAEEGRVQLERLRVEADESRSKLASETLKLQQANKKLQAESQKAVKEKTRADTETAKAEEQRKLSEMNRWKFEEEKSRANHLTQQLGDERCKLEKLEADIAERVSKLTSDCLKCEELKKKLKDKKSKAKREKKHADSAMRKAEEQRKVAEAYGEKAASLKNRAEQLAEELEDKNSDTVIVKLLRKELDLEKMQVEYAKQMASLEKGRNAILQQEIWRIKEEFSQLSDHLDTLDKCFPHPDVSINDLKKDCYVSKRQKRKLLDEEPYQIGNELVMPSCLALDASDPFKHSLKCRASLLPILGKNFTECISGIDSKLEPLLRGSAKNSSMASFSDRPFVGPQERRALSGVELDKLAQGNNTISEPTISRLSDDHANNIAEVAENSVKSPIRVDCFGEKAGNNNNKRKKILDAVESIEHLYSEGKKWHRQIAEDLSVLQEMLESRVDQSIEEELCVYPKDYRPANEKNCDASRKNSGIFEEMEDGDYYMKLLDLDNPFDEENYRVAIKRPLSPSLPEIGFRRSETLETDNSKGNNRINILYESNTVPASDDFPRCCVVFSDMNDNSSISKLFSVTKTCMAQCFMISQTDQVVQKTLSALSNVENLLPKEKVCVFFSLLLQNFPRSALDNFRDLTERGSTLLFDSFAGHMRSVLNNLETRSMFRQLLNLDELLNLIEDFLIHRRVLVHNDGSSESLVVFDPRADIGPSVGDLILSFQLASAKQLVVAAVVLASVCAAVDYIGFLCEASHNILRLRRVDSSMLDILHVFAYITGAKYFTHNDYSLLMTVVKYLVTFMERSLPDFTPCKECPLSEGVGSMDVVVSLLMEKFHNYAISDFSSEDLMEASVFMNASEALTSKEKSQPSGTLCNLGDVLSLFELVASNMSWNWTFNNIVLKLLKMLDSCVPQKSLRATVLLLGQLGRLGVNMNGYDDPRVVNLRGRLAAFMCQSTTSNMDLPIQIATATALLGLISLGFEEIIKDGMELRGVVSDYSSPAANCIRKWFSLLSSEQQSLSSRLLIAVPSCKTG